MNSLSRRESQARVPAQIAMISAGHPYPTKLVDVLAHLRDKGPHGGVFAFTAPTSGAGVTHVIRLTAEELARQTGERVLVAESGTLDGLNSRHIGKASRGAVEFSTNVRGLVQTHDLSEAPQDLERVVVDVLSRSFGFILIDCPALTKSADALLVAPQTDGVFMVVAAGETRRDEIHRARSLIREASGNLAGLILNKRTYPVPSPIFKLFK